MDRSLWVEAFRSLILGGEPLAAGDVSKAVYEKLPKAHVGAVYIALVLVVAVAVAALSLLGAGAIAYLLVLLGPPAVFFLWVYRSDRYEPEPAYLVAIAYSLGIFAGMTAQVVASAAGLALLGECLAEPLAVFVVLLWLASGEFSAEFNDHMDGLVYGAAVGLGVVTAYNYAYLKLLLLTTPTLTLFIPTAQLVAVAALNVALVAVAAIAGRWLGWVKALKGSVTLGDALPGLALYILLRGVYLAAGALTPAPLAAQLVLLAAYWALVWRFAGEALRDERLWGYAAGRAPVEG